MAPKKSETPAKGVSSTKTKPSPDSGVSTRASPRKESPTKVVDGGRVTKKASPAENTTAAKAAAIRKKSVTMSAVQAQELSMRGLADADDNDNDWDEDTDEIRRTIGKRITAEDRRIFAMIEHFEYDEQSIPETKLRSLGTELFARERAESKKGKPLKCHTKVYWRFREHWERKFNQAAHLPEEESDSDAMESIEHTGPTSPGKKAPALKKTKATFKGRLRAEDAWGRFLREAKNLSYENRKQGRRMSSFNTHSFDPNDPLLGDLKEDFIKAQVEGENLALKEKTLHYAENDEQHIPRVDYTGVISQDGHMFIPDRMQGILPKPDPSPVKPVEKPLAQGQPSARGRGAIRSATNPEFIPGDRRKNPFFETMPAEEIWHRNMPSYFPFGETPFMAMMISKQISEDLARSHDEVINLAAEKPVRNKSFTFSNLAPSWGSRGREPNKENETAKERGKKTMVTEPEDDVFRMWDLPSVSQAHIFHAMKSGARPTARAAPKRKAAAHPTVSPKRTRQTR